MLRTMTEQIIRNAKVMFPNLKVMYLASRTRAYTNANPSAPNPEPYAFESGFSVRWVIEDQIKATNNLNYNPGVGAVVAPWLSWGPYLWADGTTPRGDGFIWECTDTEWLVDLMHPSPDGVQKVATQLLSFFKTDPTATPWFLKKPGPGAPTCAPTASVTNGFRPLTVNFAANPVAGSAPFHDGKWTFEDGEFATVANPVKVFKTPGTYHAHFTVTDTNGNTAQGSVAVKVNAKWSDWLASKFTATERADLSIGGVSASPDGDKFPNLLEYAMGLEPKDADAPSIVSAALNNSAFSLTFPHYKYADDAPLALEATSDFINWEQVALTQSQDDDPVEYLTFQEPATNSVPRFFRLKSTLIPTQ
jgi:PKD repeat protein